MTRAAMAGANAYIIRDLLGHKSMRAAAHQGMSP